MRWGARRRVMFFCNVHVRGHVWKQIEVWRFSVVDNSQEYMFLTTERNFYYIWRSWENLMWTALMCVWGTYIHRFQVKVEMFVASILRCSKIVCFTHENTSSLSQKSKIASALLIGRSQDRWDQMLHVWPVDSLQQHMILVSIFRLTWIPAVIPRRMEQTSLLNQMRAAVQPLF